MPSPEAPPPPPGAGIEHVFEYVDAVTGERLAPGDVGALVPVAYAGATPLETRVRTDDEAGSPLRRFITRPPGGRYTVRVDGLGSRRYFGCEADLPAEGAAQRLVRITLLPRARDVSLQVQVRRSGGSREFPALGLREVELRADARSEHDTEVFRGTCAGERPASGSHWCVVSLAAAPGPIGLSARAPEFGVAPLEIAADDPARGIAVRATFAGHVLGYVTLRAGAFVGVLGAGSPGATFAVDVPTRSDFTGDTCPADATCVRALAHLGATYAGYGRDTELVGPATRVLPDGATSATYGLLEAGAGVTVAPGGTGDRLRLTALFSAALAARGDEYRPDGTLLSEASSRLGIVGDVFATVRLAGPFTVWAGVRSLWLPSVGARGRQFSYLGAATVSPESASLVQLGVLAGLGVEP